MSAAPTTASIVICTLNRPDDIQRCVSAIVQQSRKPKQLIVVDAGELGDVEQRLRACCVAADIEFVYCKDHPSTTKQRNRGAEFVTGDIVFFLDDDSELDADYVATILNIYDEDAAKTIGGATGVLSPNQQATRGIWRWYTRFFLLPEVRIDTGSRLKASNFPVYSTFLAEARETEIMPSKAVSFRTDVFRDFMFDVDLAGYVMAEDIDLSYRISRHYRLLVVPDAMFRHSYSPVSRNSTREHEKRRVLFTQYFFQKNKGQVGWHHLARYWALFGMALRYFYFGIRDRDMQRFKGFFDGIRLASRNHLFGRKKFVAGPLEY
jgi:glycosyltransferase involved in cell wall biosynthesis